MGFWISLALWITLTVLAVPWFRTTLADEWSGTKRTQDPGERTAFIAILVLLASLLVTWTMLWLVFEFDLPSVLTYVIPFAFGFVVLLLRPLLPHKPAWFKVASIVALLALAYFPLIQLFLQPERLHFPMLLYIWVVSRWMGVRHREPGDESSQNSASNQ
jgi:hypothetical protein